MKLTKHSLVKLLNESGMMTRDAIEDHFGIKTRVQKLLCNFTDIICELRTDGKLKEDKYWMSGEELFGVK